jgi:hypothetical protein
MYDYSYVLTYVWGYTGNEVDVAYIDPNTVIAPKDHVRLLEVLYDSGNAGWSVALLEWDGEQRIGMRWNGSQEDSRPGNPQSRGRPTWFVVPPELSTVVREEAEQLGNSQEGGLLMGYREMANDRERETEAQEWSEGLIGDATRQEG